MSQVLSNPVRCYKCQKFGHTKFNCRKNEVCNTCGQEDHTDSQKCKNERKCVNCQGNYASNEKSCAKWKEEKDIQRIKALFVYLFIWGFTSLSTLYRSYHDG